MVVRHHIDTEDWLSPSPQALGHLLTSNSSAESWGFSVIRRWKWRGHKGKGCYILETWFSFLASSRHPLNYFRNLWTSLCLSCSICMHLSLEPLQNQVMMAWAWAVDAEHTVMLLNSKIILFILPVHLRTTGMVNLYIPWLIHNSWNWNMYRLFLFQLWFPKMLNAEWPHQRFRSINQQQKGGELKCSCPLCRDSN